MKTEPERLNTRPHNGLEQERALVRAMIRCYCQCQHGTQADLCSSCRDLEQYADKRLERCVFGEDKPACVHCPIHCYAENYRERMRVVMRVAGPKMLWRHPILTLCHYLRSRRSPSTRVVKGVHRHSP